MFVCLAILQINNITPTQWNDLYTDLPSKQIKVEVSDKSLITCSSNEMEIVSPIVLQQRLNQYMKDIPSGRCFIRPSGTEDVVRIYAEADTSSNVNFLVDKAMEAIKDIIG